MAKEYPRIDLAADAIIFSYKRGEGISVLLIKRKNEPFKGCWAIPGGFVEADESIDHAVSRELKEETGIEVDGLEQLYTFGDPKRDPRKRVVSVAYYALVKSGIYNVRAADDAEGAEWFNIKKLPELAFDHKKILEMAISRLRHKISYEPVGLEILDKQFPFSDLHALYETLCGKKIESNKLCKKIMDLGILNEVKEKKSGAKKQRVLLYQFNKRKYLQLQKKGIVLEI